MPASDRATAQPKQRYARERLDELLADLRPGDPLPTERDLARELGVARMTLRRALDSLAAEHRLVRRRGAGTFVAGGGAGGKVTQRLSATSFSADMRARGMVPGSRTLATRRFPAGMMLAGVLDVPPQTEILFVRRLRLADGEPMALEDLHVPTTVAPGLEGAELDERSFYEILRDRYDQPVVSGTQTVEPAVADAETAALLGVAEGSPVFLFERTSRVRSGSVVEFVKATYRGDRYRLVVDILPLDESSTPPEQS